MSASGKDPDLDAPLIRVITFLCIASRYALSCYAPNTDSSVFRSTSNHNLVNLMQYKALSVPIQIIKLATLKLLNYAGHDSTSFLMWWDRLSLILANCFQIVANFTNPVRIPTNRQNADQETHTPMHLRTNHIPILIQHTRVRISAPICIARLCAEFFSK